MKENRFDLRLKRLAALERLVNSEIAISYFIPAVIDDKIVDVAFIYSSLATVQKKTRPFAKVMFEHKNGGLIEYKNSYIDDYMDSDKYPMTTKIDYSLPGEVSVAEQVEAMKKINAYYDEICELAYKTDISDESKEKIREYKTLFYKSVPEMLLPYYEALSPEFFIWLNNISE